MTDYTERKEFKLTETEKQRLQRLAVAYTGGNDSEFLRRCIRHTPLGGTVLPVVPAKELQG